MSYLKYWKISEIKQIHEEIEYQHGVLEDWFKKAIIETIKEEFISFDEIAEIEITDENYDSGEIRVNGTEYLIFKDSYYLDEYLKEYLTDDPYMWKISVKDDCTTLGLEDWASEVIRYDGADQILGTETIYDYNPIVLKRE